MHGDKSVIDPAFLLMLLSRAPTVSRWQLEVEERRS